MSSALKLAIPKKSHLIVKNMQIPGPTEEHQFLLKLVGDWKLVSECAAGPDQPPQKTIGKQSTQAIGSLWTLGEMETPGPDGKLMRSLITLGFDPARGKFVGTFVASCMTFLWLYEGTLDSKHRILTLHAEGPSFTSAEKMAKYQDIIEVVDDDTYLFSSRYQDDSGEWVTFMDGRHTRIK